MATITGSLTSLSLDEYDLPFEPVPSAFEETEPQKVDPELVEIHPDLSLITESERTRVAFLNVDISLSLARTSPNLYVFQEPLVPEASSQETEMQKIDRELAEINTRLSLITEDERVQQIDLLNEEIPFADPVLQVSGVIPGLGLPSNASILDISNAMMNKIDALKDEISEFELSSEVLKAHGSRSSNYKRHIQNVKHLAELDDNDPLYVLGKKRKELLDRKYDLEFTELQSKIDVIEGTLQGLAFLEARRVGIEIPQIHITPTLLELNSLYEKQFQVIKKDLLRDLNLS